ncbi:hypothetical protein [Escherichia coli]|uniref:hypothetical protein n=1 Tax=Escherichia coli TaxID=562 RepID=UPI003F807EFB
MRYLLIVIIFIIGFSALPVWAMDCYAEHEGGNTVVIGYVPRISIPSNGKKGDKIWQSSEYFMNVFCNNALPAPSPGEEYPSAWTNIMMFLPGGQDFYNQNSYIFGVTYNGVDYDSTAPNAIAAPECIDIKGAGTFNNHYKNPAVCSGGPEPQLSVTFPARVQLYIKLAKNANRVNKNLVLPDEYIALEFKGMCGAGAIEVDKNLTFRIRGLNNIHVLDCFVNVALEPADGVVDFGKINSRTIKNTSVSETFSVVMTKDPGAACTEQFNILGSFFTTDILSDYSHLDMGNGLLLKIFHKDGTATEFNRFSQFASFSSSSAPSVTAPFRAELSANPAETVVEGPFSKDVILKITYN